MNTKATIQLTPYEAVGHYFMLGGEPLDVKSYPYLKAVLNTRCPEVGLFTARQVAKCCAASTYIVLQGGDLKTIGEIKPGEMVCATGPDFKTTARKVVGVFDNGEQECFEVTTKGGAILTLTAGHRLRTALGYTHVRDLKVDDTVASAETAGVFLDQVPAGGETRIILTAYMLGDGCCGLSGTWNFTKASSECLNEVLKLDPENTRLDHKNNTPAKSVGFRADAPIRQWITEDGGNGKYSHQKVIPAWVFNLSRPHTALFLSRLWATDGCVALHSQSVNCTYVSTSEIMLRQVQSLLRKLGIRSTKDSYTPKCKGKEYRTAYRLRIAGYDAVLRFYSEVGYVPGKPPIYTTITTERRSTTITAPLAVNDLLRAAYAPFSAIPKRNRTGGIFDRGLKWPAGRLSQDKLREWIAAFKEMNLDTSALEPFDNGGVWWDTIDSIKSVGVQRVYDMEVEEDHNYLIDTGIVSHNSTTLAMKLVLKAINEPQSSQIYIAPLQDQAEVFSMQRLRDFILDSPIVKDGFFAGPGVVDQVFRKIFSNRSIIACGYAQRTADRLRGRSCGSILLDESFCKYSTYVETERGVTRIDKVKIGDKVWSFDQKNKAHTLDTVVRVLDHGRKITWKLMYDDGTCLYATSGSRFLAESGWVYLHELVDTVLNANAAADPHGQYAGRRVPDETCSSPPKTVFPPWGKTGSIRDTQGNAFSTHGQSGTKDSAESGMGRVELRVQHAYFATLRFHASNLFSRRAREALAAEGSNASMAGPTDLGGDSLLVHGRWESEQSVFREYCNARFFQTRELSSGLVVVLERDRDGGATNGAWHQSLLLSSPESRSFPALHRQDSPLYNPVYDVQNSNQSSANSRMHDVRLIIPASEHGSVRHCSLLPSRRLSGPTQSELPATSARYLQPDSRGVRALAGSVPSTLPSHDTGTTRRVESATTQAARADQSRSNLASSVPQDAESMAQANGSGSELSTEIECQTQSLLRTEESRPSQICSNTSSSGKTNDQTQGTRDPCSRKRDAPPVANSQPREVSRTAGTPTDQTQSGDCCRQPSCTPDRSRTHLHPPVDEQKNQEDANAGQDVKGVCTRAEALHPTAGSVEAGSRKRTGQETQTTEKGATLVSIEFAGYRDVFDLETEVHHNFYANGILTHNCQDIMAEVIPIIKEMAFRVKNPSYWYCGTPKSFNNHMEAMRARSTGNEWGVKCQHTGCKKWNLNWNEKNIGNLGVICEHCGLPLNTDAGQWIASRRMDIEKGKDAKVTMESFRIPQLIVKPIMDIPRKWIEIIGKLKNYSAEQFNNEVLGLPFDSGSQPITLEQLMACCISTRSNVLPDPRDTSLPPLVMGVDWAFIGENSYTVVVIGGWEPYPTKFNVYYYHIYKGVETDSTRQENDIITMARSLGIRLIGADWGAGHVQNLHLINALGEEHVAQLWHTGMNGAARKAQRAKWEPKTRKWHLARTAVLTDTFENLRRRQVTLPRYEECVEFCDQILAESLEFNDKTNTVRYVNMNPDDCLHALTYAMLAGELLIRGDFAGHDGQASPEMPGSRKPDIGTEDDWGVGHEMYG